MCFGGKSRTYTVLGLLVVIMLWLDAFCDMRDVHSTRVAISVELADTWEKIFFKKYFSAESLLLLHRKLSNRHYFGNCNFDTATPSSVFVTVTLLYLLTGRLPPLAEPEAWEMFCSYLSGSFWREDDLCWHARLPRPSVPLHLSCSLLPQRGYCCCYCSHPSCQQRKCQMWECRCVGQQADILHINISVLQQEMMWITHSHQPPMCDPDTAFLN